MRTSGYRSTTVSHGATTSRRARSLLICQYRYARNPSLSAYSIRIVGRHGYPTVVFWCPPHQRHFHVGRVGGRAGAGARFCPDAGARCFESCKPRPVTQFWVPTCSRTKQGKRGAYIVNITLRTARRTDRVCWVRAPRRFRRFRFCELALDTSL